MSLEDGSRPISYGSKALKGTLTSAFFQISATIISLATTMVLARLLSPEEYGIIDMVATLAALLAITDNLGLSLSTIQRDEITDEQVNSLFWLNSGFGFLLWGLSALAAPLMVLFYSEPALYWVTPCIGMNFFLGGIGAQPGALLQRRFQFDKLGTADVVAKTCGLLAGIAGALFGLSYWALVLNTLVTTTVRTLLLLAFSRIRPTLPRPGTGIRPMVEMGGWYAGFGFMNYITRNLDNILIGRLLGAAALGLYARAYQLYLLPYKIFNSVLGQVAIPTLSRLQSDKERLQKAYVQLVQVVLLTASASAGWLAVIAPEVIEVVLGAQWLRVVPLFRIFSIVGIFQPLLGSNGWIYIATGKTKRMFAWSFIPAAVLSTAFVIGVQYGLEGVAFAYAIGWVGLLLVPGMIVALATIDLRFGVFVARVARHLVVVALSIGCAILIRSGCLYVTHTPVVSILLFAILTGGCHYLLVLLLVPQTLRDIRILAAVRDEAR